MKQINFARGIFLLLLFICAVITGTLLKITASVVIPVTVAVLLAFVFQPLIAALNKRFHIPVGIGITIIFVILFVAMLVIGNLLFSSFKTIFALYPKYEERLTVIYETVATIFKLPFDEETSLFENLWGQLGIRTAIQNAAVSLSNILIAFVKNLTVVSLFVIFFLAELRLFKTKAAVAFDGQNSGKITLIIKDIILQVTRYISVKFFISLLTGVLVFLGTLAVHMDFPIVWGFLAFILNFIPNFGSIISGLITTLFALIQFWPKPGPVVFVGFLMIAVNMILGNIVEPRIQGRNLGLSPFVIIVSLSVWGWMWGFMGMLLAVPMMVILKIICENVSILKPLSILMGSKPTEEVPSEK
ncbi:AI-2E family transporter [Treponema brennaborense]|uniref:AI-2E family transporter n=1 Tax=Treponema brennaborense (strain DSM 12168 / CIP 105900 / DD5/3) TaxID=906968 RepID=F4LL06_TREBD|nr:AI-2E family transporter [Treponema brennaborense]AEE16603.1 protein of unknown function UPF0118 [Treponema brennaborense DSM 12168]